MELNVIIWNQKNEKLYTGDTELIIAKDKFKFLLLKPINKNTDIGCRRSLKTN